MLRDEVEWLHQISHNLSLDREHRARAGAGDLELGRLVGGYVRLTRATRAAPCELGHCDAG